MPPVEGQAVGRVVISSNIEPLKSVAGNGACLVDPFSVASIREGICKVIADAEYRNQLIENGLKNAERFRAEGIAKKYLQVYHEILGE